MNFRLLLLLVPLFFISCTADENSKEEDAAALTDSYNEIVVLSQVNSTACTNAQDWDFTAIGSKACGGAAGYIAYSLKINVSEFLTKVDNYTKVQKAYNEKWNIISTCEVMMPPSRVDCVEGKTQLIYN